MNPITKFFHELFNPHCEHCIEQRTLELEFTTLAKICQSCETLKMQLSVSNQLNDKLLNKLTETKVETITQQTERQVPIQTRQIPWHIKRQQLEQESRELANSKKNAAIPDSISELEQSIGIENGTIKTINS